MVHRRGVENFVLPSKDKAFNYSIITVYTFRVYIYTFRGSYKILTLGGGRETVFISLSSFARIFLSLSIFFLDMIIVSCVYERTFIHTHTLLLYGRACTTNCKNCCRKNCMRSFIVSLLEYISFVDIQNSVVLTFFLLVLCVLFQGFI